jgi:hypothetical protein
LARSAIVARDHFRLIEKRLGRPVQPGGLSRRLGRDRAHGQGLAGLYSAGGIVIAHRHMGDELPDHSLEHGQTYSDFIALRHHLLPEYQVVRAA